MRIAPHFCPLLLYNCCYYPPPPLRCGWFSDVIPAFLVGWSARSSLKLTLIRRVGQVFLGGFHVLPSNPANILLQIWILVWIAGARQHRVVGQFVAQRERGGAGGSGAEQFDRRASVWSWQGWRHQESPAGLWKVRMKRSNIAFEAEHWRHAAPPLFKRSGHVCAKAEASSFAGAAAGSSMWSQCGVIWSSDLTC